MVNTGSNGLDSYFNYPNSLTCIYGGPASGKTTLCFLASLYEKGKVIFIDTENGFSIERIKQLGKNVPKNIFMLKAGDFYEQCELVENLLKLKSKVKLIIIDSFTRYYRKELQERKDVNPKLSRQLSILSEISRESNIPIILTSQIYSTMDNKIEAVGGKMLKNWCPCIIRLENEEERKIILEKHPEKFFLDKKFEIVGEGIRL